MNEMRRWENEEMSSENHRYERMSWWLDELMSREVYELLRGADAQNGIGKLFLTAAAAAAAGA